MRTNLDEFTYRCHGPEKAKRRNFGKQVLELRQRHDISKKEFAKCIGVSDDALDRIERGQVSPDIPALNKRLSRVPQRKMIIS